MTELMDKYFYDKSVTFYKIDSQTSAEGGRSKGAKQEIGTIKCNIRHISSKDVREQYGIDLDTSVLITCANKERVDKGFKFTFKEEEYAVVEILYFDSHKKILCQ